MNLVILQASSAFGTVFLIIGIILFLLAVPSLIFVLYYFENKHRLEEQEIEVNEEIVNEKQEEVIVEDSVDPAIKKISDMGLERSHLFSVDSDSDGVMAIGIVYNKTSNVYMFSPKDEILNVGDVVVVTDVAGRKRKVPVVIPNTKIKDANLKEIDEVLYRHRKEEVKTYQISFAYGFEPIKNLLNVPNELPTPVKEGFIFNGWSLRRDYMESIKLGSPLERDIHLYPLWEEIIEEKDINGVYKAFFYSSQDQDYEDIDIDGNYQLINEKINQLLEEKGIDYYVVDKDEFDDLFPYVDLERFNLTNVDLILGDDLRDYKIDKNQDKIYTEIKKLLKLYYMQPRKHSN